jgi:membrane associated rhomboid family serine protease
MIETMCSCGSPFRAAEAAAGGTTPCPSCGRRVRLTAAEPITVEGAAGDFDARLVITAGPCHVGETLALGGVPDIELGTGEGRHILLPSNMVSRAHAKMVRLDFGPSRWKVVDTNSRNGIFINGHKVVEAELNDGDSLHIGDYRLRYAVGLPQIMPAVIPSSKKDEQICKGCGNHFPANALVCTTCGINLKTGRTLVTSRDIDENDMAIRANRWIRIISWFIWFGLFPIASEALGTHKPRATWTITIVTILISAFFLAGRIANHGRTPDQLKNYMLWAGDARARQANAAETNRMIDQFIERQEKRAQDQGNEIDQQQLRDLRSKLHDEVNDVGEFHWYQLLTNALLHGGIMHLAGNLVFLLVFGLRVNELIGDLKMSIVYPVLAICSGAIYAFAERHQPLQPALGASGAIMGLAGMYFVFFPLHRVHMAIWLRAGIFTGWRVFYKLFRMKGFWLLALWVGLNDVLPTVIQAYSTGVSHDHVAHWAHLGGFISGVVIALGLLFTRQVSAHGADILSVTLGPKAWSLIGTPGHRAATINLAVSPSSM